MLSTNFHRFWHELKRRKTIRTVIAYLLILATIVGPTSDILGGLNAPDWILRTIISLLLALFPVVLAISWVFDFTTHGFERTPQLEDTGQCAEEATEFSATAATRIADSATSARSVSLELGTAQRHQIALLRCTFNLLDKGTPCDDPDILVAMLPALNTLVAAICNEYSATIHVQEGYAFQLLFGYPANIEDETFWAVNAALSLQERVAAHPEIKLLGESLDVATSMSVHSASVITDQPCAHSSAFTLAGSAVEESAWLQTLSAPGTIVMDSHTRALLRNRVHSTSLGYLKNPRNEFMVELFSIANAARSMNWPGSTVLPDKTLIGRESELLLLKDRWQRALEGEEEHVVLRGESGIGKTALTNELVRMACCEEQAMVFAIRCVPMMMTSPFYPILHYFRKEGRQIFRMLLQRFQLQSTRKCNSAMAQLSGAAMPSPALLAFDEPAGAPVPAAQESIRAEILMQLIDIFLDITKDKTLMLVFEDLQWADPSTLKVLDLLTTQTSRAGALCIYTTRSPAALNWENCSNLTTLNLEKLSRKATRSLVLSIVGERKVAPSCLNHLVDEAKGNPFIAEELAKALAAETAGNSREVSKELRSTEILMWFFNSRIEKLGKLRPLLQICSMLGNRFSYGLIQAVCKPSSETVLREELRQLVSAGFLEQQGLVPRSHYCFRNRILQQAAYESIPRLNRSKLHREILSSIEGSATGLDDDIESMRAYHRAQAEFKNSGSGVPHSNRHAAALLQGPQDFMPASRDGTSNVMKFPEQSREQWDNALLSDHVV